MSCCRGAIFRSKSLAGCIFLALSIISASPVHLGIEEVPIARVLDTKRARALYNSQKQKRDGAIIAVQIQDHYTTTIYTSDESVEYDVIIDTGSSYTWVGADPKNPYIKGRSGWATGHNIEIMYGSGPFEADEYIDTIILETTASSDILTVYDQSIGSATLVTDFSSLLDGILGLGRKESSSMRGLDGNRIPTLLDNLYSQGSIRYAAFGVYFIPLNDRGVGEITFGYCDEAVITSHLNYVPNTNTPTASNFWGVDGYFMYNGRTVLNPTSGIVDTGSNIITMPKDACLAYQSATGATADSEGWLIITLEQYDNLQNLSIIIGGQSYDLSPNAQIKPHHLLAGPFTLVVSDTPDGVGWDFILGHPFIQRYYVCFNATSSQIGFASTPNTESTTN